MKIRTIGPSPYAMMAAFTDTAELSAASALLCALVREKCPDEVMVRAAVLSQEYAMVVSLEDPILARPVMSYLFMGVSIDPAYWDLVRSLRGQAHPGSPIQSPAEFCVMLAHEYARNRWLDQTEALDPRISAAYVGALDGAIRRHLLTTVRQWATIAHAEQYERQGGKPLDYGLDQQRGFQQMRVDLINAVGRMLELTELRAAVLEQTGALPSR